MCVINPLDIPEIRTLIVQFLTSTDLVCCLQVCKAWYEAYLPHVWSTVSIQKHWHKPTMDALNHHRELVKTMSFVGVDSQYISVPFPNLKRLDVLSSNLLWKLPHGLNNLTKLSITGIDIAQEDAATFWNMCTQLESLYIDTCSIPQLPEKSATFGFFNRLVDLYLYMSPRQLREKEAWWINWTSQLHNVIALDLDFHTAENNAKGGSSEYPVL
ncbi:hypothetical protein B0O80DRAFT_463627 [Mortierella sp. GBAus27b]|nr:hypothetical protein B0O80DRAFT_463627 [Mortierella sp. GBAus27b]